jgi:hypothetical protein
VKGKQVKESSLRQVPEAAAAVAAVNAQNAQLAQNAVNSENANIANRATDSDAIGGLGAAALEKSSRTQFTRGSETPPNQASEGVVNDWPEAGFRITVPAQGGCANTSDVTLRITNLRTSGPELQVVRPNGTTASVPSGESVSCSLQGGRWEGVASYPDRAQTLFFDCRRTSGDVRCLSVRSEP